MTFISDHFAHWGREKIFSLQKGEDNLPSWQSAIPVDLWPFFDPFLHSPLSERDYLSLRCRLLPLLLMNPLSSPTILHELFFYSDLKVLLGQKIDLPPSPVELPSLCKKVAESWISSERESFSFTEEEYSFIHFIALPTDIYFENRGEADCLLMEIDNFNSNLLSDRCDLLEGNAKKIIHLCFHLKTIHLRDRDRLLSFLIQKPTLHPHLILREQLMWPYELLPSLKVELREARSENLSEATLRMKELLSHPSLEKECRYPKLLFSPIEPSLMMQRGSYDSYLTVVLNIFTGKVSAHTDLMYWKKHTPSTLYSITDIVWRQIKNGSLLIEGDEGELIAQLASDLKILLKDFGADDSLNLQRMDPHLFTLEGMKEYVDDKFILPDTIDSTLVASSICQACLGLIALSRPMDREVLGIGADHDGTVTHSHTGNARYYRVHLSPHESEKEFERKVRRYAEYMQGPLQATMNASVAVNPEVVSAFLLGTHLNLSFSEKELDELLYETIVTELASDLFPHSLDLFSHIPTGKHKQYSKIIVEGCEQLIENDRGCYRENKEEVPYVIYPGTIQPIPFHSPSSAACVSLGRMTEPINPMDHRSLQHGMISGLPIYKREGFDYRVQRCPKGKGQTIFIDHKSHYELKGFIPNNLVKRMTSRSHSCSSFVFLMLHAAYFSTYGKGFDRDMDAIRAQFLPKTAFEAISIDLTEPYEKVRMAFQQQAVTMIESIWEDGGQLVGGWERYQEEILPLIISSHKGKRLSRAELSKIRTLSQLHCPGAEKRILRLGRFIHWFFPAATESTALEMKELAMEAHALLREQESYQTALQEIKKKFDISPMRTSPGLLLDLFERERIAQSSLFPLLPQYLYELSTIFNRSLKTSRYDPFGYQMDPSQIRAMAIDIAPKSVGNLRRIIQAALSPIHLFSQLLLPKAYNRAMFMPSTQFLAKRICFVAEAPLPNKRSQAIENFESTAFIRLCDLIELGSCDKECYSLFESELTLIEYQEKATKLREQLKELKEWKNDVQKASYPLVESALSHVHFRTVTEESLQDSIKKGKELLQGDPKAIDLFDRSVDRAMRLLRDTMVNLKTIFLDLHADLCGALDLADRPSLRDRIYDEQARFERDLRNHRLLTFEEWSQEFQLPSNLEEEYQRFYHAFRKASSNQKSPDAMGQLLDELESLVEKIKIVLPSRSPVEVLDYPLLHLTLLLLDQQVDDHHREISYFQHSLVEEWMALLFAHPTDNFLHFLGLMKGAKLEKKMALLEEILLIHPAFQDEAPESLLLLRKLQKNGRMGQFEI